MGKALSRPPLPQSIYTSITNIGAGSKFVITNCPSKPAAEKMLATRDTNLNVILLSSNTTFPQGTIFTPTDMTGSFVRILAQGECATVLTSANGGAKNIASVNSPNVILRDLPENEYLVITSAPNYPAGFINCVVLKTSPTTARVLSQAALGFVMNIASNDTTTVGYVLQSGEVLVIS
jgi:hypothetical protein